MDKSIRDKWLDALRSGNYTQGRSRLRRDNKFCCLGVLCDVVDPQGWGWPSTINGQRLHHGKTDRPNDDLLATMKLGGEIYELMSMNDYGQSFAEIADHIESTL